MWSLFWQGRRSTPSIGINCKGVRLHIFRIKHNGENVNNMSQVYFWKHCMDIKRAKRSIRSYTRRPSKKQ